MGFSSISMESFQLLVPNADLCWDISSDKAFGWEEIKMKCACFSERVNEMSGLGGGG